MNKVNTDDAMIVIANALIDPNCSHKHLSIAALHFNETYSETAYKALAYALSINTSLQTVTMTAMDYCGEICCNFNDYYDDEDDYDTSNGLLVKALRSNQSHNIYRIDHCYSALGEEVEREIKALLKPCPAEATSKKRKAM